MWKQTNNFIEIRVPFGNGGSYREGGGGGRNGDSGRRSPKRRDHHYRTHSFRRSSSRDRTYSRRSRSPQRRTSQQPRPRFQSRSPNHGSSRKKYQRPSKREREKAKKAKEQEQAELKLNEKMSEARLCRLCATLANVAYSKNLFQPNQREVLGQVEALTGLQLENTNELPQLICESCQTQALLAHDFRERCIQAQQQFNMTKYTNQIKEEPTDEAVMFEITMVKDEVIEENEKEQEEEQEGEELLPHESEVHIKPEPTNLEESSSNDGFLRESHYDSDEEPMQASNSEVVKDEHKTETTPTTQNKKRCFNIDVQTFACEQCGLILKRRSHFEIHMQRHNGDKQFACNLCTLKYVTSTELKNHMRKHTGEKPYPCRYCGYRLKNASSRARHERSHTNDRLYECQECKRSFTGLSDLKRHAVVHTGERPFECNFCNVSFGFKKHLRQHQGTKNHKLTEAKHKQMASVESVIDGPLHTAAIESHQPEPKSAAAIKSFDIN